MGRPKTDDADGEVLSRFARVMRARGRPTKTIDFPGLAGERVALWCPTDGEEGEADAEARKYLTGHLKLDALQLSLAVESGLHRRERELELLALVLRDPDDPTQAYVEGADDLRDHLEAPQREALVAQVRAFQRERLAVNTPETAAEIVRLVRGLGEAGALSSYWTSCDSDTQLAIVLALVEAWPTPTAPNSSGT